MDMGRKKGSFLHIYLGRAGVAKQSHNLPTTTRNGKWLDHVHTIQCNGYCILLQYFADCGAKALVLKLTMSRKRGLFFLYTLAELESTSKAITYQLILDMVNCWISYTQYSGMDIVHVLINFALLWYFADHRVKSMGTEANNE